MPFGFGGGGRAAAAAAAASAARMASRSNSAAAARRRTFPTCSRACSAAAGGGGGGGPFGGFGRRSAPPQKGADVAYRLDGRRSRMRRGSSRPAGHARQRQDARHQAAAGVEDGTKIRLAGQGQPGPAGNGDAIVTIAVKPHRFFRREGDNIRLDLPISIDEAVLGAQGPGADGRRAGDAERPQGLELGQGAAPQGQGLHRQGRRSAATSSSR